MRRLIVACALCACTSSNQQATSSDSSLSGLNSSPAPFEHRTVLNLTATGAFTPGAPVTITIEARSHRASQSTRLRMGITSTAGGQIAERVLIDTLTPLPEGAVVRSSRAHVFGAPGYYLITATSRTAESDEPRKAPERNVPLANENAAQVWILITPTGGRLDRVFDESVAERMSLTASPPAAAHRSTTHSP